MGIDVGLFIGTAHDPFICNVCRKVVEDPVTTSCEHLYCRTCFSPGRCRNRRCERILHSSYPLGKVLDKVYQALELAGRCRVNGCDQTLTISNFERHEETCSKRTVDCKTCESKMTAEQFSSHCCMMSLTDQVNLLKAQVSSLENQVKSSNQQVKSLKKELGQIGSSKGKLTT